MQRYLKRILTAALAAFASMAALGAAQAQAQECMIGEIRMFGGNFAPRSWALANGQLLPIAQNQALFSILGTTYGGDGRNTFALPDLRGRAAISAGQGPGLSTYRLGQAGGVETTTMTVPQMPAHTHGATTQSTTTSSLKASANTADSADPDGRVLADGGNDRIYLSDGSPGVDMNAAAIESTTNSTTQVASTGGSQSMTNVQPYQAVNYIICLQGIFPSRS